MPSLINNRRERTYSMKRIFGIILLAVILILMILLDQGINGLFTFWNAPSLIIVLVITLSMLMLSDNLSDFTRGFNIVMSSKEYTTKELNSSYNAIDTSIKLIYLSGFIGIMIGCIGILSQIDDPSAYGPALAVALLTVFYSALINIFLYATRAKIKKELIYRS